ncbi:MAG TPA: nuclear transport factor 2 family protein [Sphingobacteriaceae bacterium]
MNRFLLFVFLSALSLSAAAQDPKPLLKVIEGQRQAWNNGHLEEFMQGYWKSDSLVFVGSNGPKHGWQTTLDNYRKSYPDKGRMGYLSFDIREVRFIDPGNALILLKWQLKREKDEPNGYSTILMKKIAGEWKMVYDHSS